MALSDSFARVVAGDASGPLKEHNGWLAVVANGSSYEEGTVEAFAYCANTGQAVAASRNHAQDRAQGAALVARLAAKLARFRARSGR